ncbi:sodium-independent anion transporter [Micrococcus sp. HMSC067E09]|uniref:SulP family inorganic anion transporter n=1 Tax=Micrococcus TaxID=1269 RepID=UPI0008A58257|nr:MULTISPECIES: SulP family inorganic anion transporter [Micrococcus]OFR89603.1 sodium-independent anion transporter [Micrococcus sp. HMSC067E09]WIK81689.1 SulP family inorganic anion transporter [Micrococcus lylae]
MSDVPEPAPELRQSVLATLRRPGWLRTEVLAGLIVALALIPEALAFAVIAGVDPRYGLFASFIMAVTTSVLGGRPAMVSAATGATALVLAPLVASHGVEYMLAAVVLAGVFQILFALAGIAKLMRFIPRSVMVGFVNALAIFVFSAQLPELIGVPWAVYPLTALGLAVVVGLSRLGPNVPAPLIAIVVVTAVAVLGGIQIPAVGDKGELPRSLPFFVLPDVPLTAETLRTIAPSALTMALVGLIESLLSAKLVDDITDTRSDKTRESWAQGVANGISGLFGAMGGCAVVGQTLMNVKASGARTRVSTFLAGVFLLALILLLGEWVARMPMAALVAVMVYVSVTAFDWHSVRPSTLRRMPLSETVVMVTTVVVTVATHNLALGVGAGVLVAMVAFARRVAHLVRVERVLKDDDGRTTAAYTVTGQLFFASSNDLYTQFHYAEDPAHVQIDLTGAQLWDASTVAALDSVLEKYDRRGTAVEIVGMDPASRRLRERFGDLLR